MTKLEKEGGKEIGKDFTEKTWIQRGPKNPLQLLYVFSISNKRAWIQFCKRP